ncbi:MAG: N-acetyltransferase family protein [Dehalococcoidia bacterium]
MSFPMVRPATEADLEAMNRIYNREVREGVATWELDEWPDERRLEWFRARDPQEEPVLVVTFGGELAGFAYLTKYRGRRGYQFTRENTVFIDPQHHRRGLGRLVLAELIERGRWMGLRSILAFIDTENEGSIALHRALGYEQIGSEFETGRKFGTWRSSVELQLLLDRPDVE